MLPLARRNNIKEILAEKKSITVSELSKNFKVTEETIRKDLQALEEEGYLNRTYGGAYISEVVETDVNINIREHIHTEGKNKIAEESIKLISDGDSIFLDASTTCLHIAQKISDMRLTVATNSVKILNELVKKPNINLVFIGGKIDLRSMASVGTVAEANMNNYLFNKVFISCRALHLTHGITDSNEQQAQIRKIALTNSNKSILVCDYTKFDRVAFSKISSFNGINTVVVDRKLSKEWVEFFDSNNTKLIQCD